MGHRAGNDRGYFRGGVMVSEAECEPTDTVYVVLEGFSTRTFGSAALLLIQTMTIRPNGKYLMIKKAAPVIAAVV